jgi:nifR3 family TIM-barrel protein
VTATTTPTAPLRIGPLTVDPPVVLAPMAGVTNPAFRTLCARFGALLGVSEMITARALVERHRTTLAMVARAPDADTHSVQLYGVDPAVVGLAVRILTEEVGADHVDLNFGCPAAKVTRKGGGAALPAHPVLLGRILAAAVDAAGDVPVTMKMRMGIDEDLRTDTEAARIAADAGVAAIALHARTATQLYSGQAHWEAIAELKASVAVHSPATPVLGNGDIFSGEDAVRMMTTTGCDGVVVGRGCLGRPWLFAELAAALTGQPVPPDPTLGEIVATMVEHLDLLCAHTPSGGRPGVEVTAVRDFRKHVGWYLQAVPVGSAARQAMMAAETRNELVDELHRAPDTLGSAFVPDPLARRQPRGHTHGPRPIALPPKWLDHPDDPEPPAGADSLVSGG